MKTRETGLLTTGPRDHPAGGLLAPAPNGPLGGGAALLPELDAVVMNVHDQAHAFCKAAEARVSEEPPYVERSVVRPNVQPDEAVRRVTKRPAAEPAVLGEERHPSKLV
jgi:hypothetical protein